MRWKLPRKNSPSDRSLRIDDQGTRQRKGADGIRRIVCIPTTREGGRRRRRGRGGGRPVLEGPGFQELPDALHSLGALSKAHRARSGSCVHLEAPWTKRGPPMVRYHMGFCRYHEISEAASRARARLVRYRVSRFPEFLRRPQKILSALSLSFSFYEALSPFRQISPYSARGDRSVSRAFIKTRQDGNHQRDG